MDVVTPTAVTDVVLLTEAGTPGEAGRAVVVPVRLTAGGVVGAAVEATTDIIGLAGGREGGTRAGPVDATTVSLVAVKAMGEP